jgi:hypothetical protein
VDSSRDVTFADAFQIQVGAVDYYDGEIVGEETKRYVIKYIVLQMG